MSSGWIALAVAVTGFGLMLATTWLKRAERADLGSVSHQWIAEERASHGYDRQR